MAPQLSRIAPGLTGFASCVAPTGAVGGMSFPEEEGWLVQGAAVTQIAPGVHRAVPAALNAAGVAVGTIGEGDDTRAFSFDGQMHDLQGDLGTSVGTARGISDAGVVVGASAHVASPRRAFRLDTATGQLIQIPFADGLTDDYVTSIAVAVTRDGRLAIGVAAKAFSQEPRGFCYDHDTGISTDLGPDLLPRAINELGVLAGGNATTGDITSLDLATGERTPRGRGLVEGINDAGVIVGSMQGTHPEFANTPFFGRPGQPLVDAAAIAAPGPLWFTSVIDVTDTGQLIGTATVVDPATGQPVTDAAGRRQFAPVTMSID